MVPTPLLNIYNENKLNENNYKERKRNLIVFLSCEKLKTVHENECPLVTQVEVRKLWEESDEIASYYMLASVTNTLYKQLESCKNAKAILDKPEDMFGGQATLAQ
ncbi:uncharacterized protein LOC105771881 [Gossypium raimondii]|uniref:uncharacterized protein LOC105771881 n=1 Tax=Gossypium raimondii TaxID=29730 RepID=UPI00063AC4CD|nr:uncharacterized protein LOC105771881 [Gossypium raimondii]